MWADPRVTNFFGGRPFTTEESWTRFLRYIGHWELLGFGYWVVEEKSTGAFAGELGLANYKREVEPPLEPEYEQMPEIGWAFAAAAHGKGYATEAAKAALAWADGHFGAARTAPGGADSHVAAVKTFCLIDPTNTASIRVAEKCGFVRCRDGTYKSKPTIVFVR